MNIIEALISFFKEIGNKSWEYQLYAAAAILVLLLVISIFRSNRSYEVRLLRSVNKLNKFFAKNPNITADNLVEFNNMMKSVPSTLRYCWQEYLLNRDKLPSEYMSTRECVDQPSKTSSYMNATSHLKTFTVVASLLLSLLSFGAVAASGTSTFEIMISGIAVPALLLVFGLLFVAFMESRHTALIADLYYSYHEFERNINKACSTLPESIDYEILFTKKEIKQGIPVLQEYLEKMALIEQRKKEEDNYTNYTYEEYDFEKLGVDNSLLLDRAMLESEKYINVKRNLTERIKAKEQEKANYQKQFDEVTKEYEKKAQTSKETLNQLSEQMSSTTVKIEANYLRKRFDDEHQRLQQLTRDYEMAQTSFNKEQEAFQAEIDKYTQDINKRKAVAEEAMIAECKTYVNKVYNKVTETVVRQTEPIMKELEDKKLGLEENVTKLEAEINDKTTKQTEMQTKLDALEKEYQEKVAEIQGLKMVREYFTSSEFVNAVRALKKDGKKDSGDVVEGDNAGLSIEDNEKIVATMKQHEELVLENEKLKNMNDELSEANEKLENKSRDLTTEINSMYKTQSELQEENSKLQKEYASLSESISDTIAALAEGQEKLVAITQAQVEAENKTKKATGKSTTSKTGKGQSGKGTKSSKTAKAGETATPTATEIASEGVKDNAMNAYNEVDSLKKSLSKLKNTVDKVKANTSGPLTVTRKARVKSVNKAKIMAEQNAEIDKKVKNIMSNTSKTGNDSGNDIQ